MVIDNPLGNSKFNHIVGDDPRAWSNGYSVEANFTQMQWGSIPGPHDQIFDGKMGLDRLKHRATFLSESCTAGCESSSALTLHLEKEAQEREQNRIQELNKLRNASRDFFSKCG